MPTATFVTTDGVAYAVPAGPDVNLLDAADAAGYTLTSMCRQGGCGVCRARRASGVVRVGEHAPDALPPDAEKTGQVLLCRTYATSDVTIELPYDSTRLASAAVPVRQVRITSIDRWPGGIVAFSVVVVPDAQHGSALQFEAGQFAELTPPDGAHARVYSFASIGNWDGTAEFYVKLRPGGYFSEYLRGTAQVGDVLTMRGPQGAFALHETGRPRWMVCGGTGLAPLMSMLRHMADWGETTEARLILGVNRPDEVFATDALADLQASLPSLCVLVPVVEPDASWDGPVGTAVDVLARELDALPAGAVRPDLYLCGPPGFLDAAHAAAASHGVPGDQVFEERVLRN
ncbi:MAG: 2Fe-2S iron-sulfur cluster binding domain-containing protein [Actinomycetia bacterium]|nr:2Fe-2S iron-sulfur cluster binding domain-containing protein [Actinomycetes bacterium]